MIAKFTKILSAAMLIFATTSCVAIGQSKGINPTFSLTLSAPKAEVKLGARVWITILQTNLSDQTIDCSAQAGSGVNYSYKYDVRDEQGTEAPKVVLSHPELGTATSFQRCTLPAGESRTSESLISRIYQFNQPGVYSIQVSRLATANRSDGFIKSNAITITILPADDPGRQ